MMREPVLAGRCSTQAMTARATSSASTTRFSGVAAASFSSASRPRPATKSVATGPGGDAHHPHVGAQHAGERNRHRFQRRFRRAVGDVAPRPVQRRHGGDVHHHRRRPGAQQGQQRADHRIGAAGIGDQDLVEQRLVQRCQIDVRDRPGHAGRIHQHIDPAIRIPHRIRHRPHRGRVGDIDRQRQVARARQRPSSARARASPDRYRIATSAPASASARTLAAPMPALPPVTTATLPASSGSLMSLLPCAPDAGTGRRREEAKPPWPCFLSARRPAGAAARAAHPR